MAGTPTVTRGTRTSLMDTGGLIPNIADTLDALDPRDVPFLSMLGWGKVAPKEKGAAKGADSLAFECNQTTHTWLNDELIPNTFTLNGAYTAGSGTFDVGTTFVDYININDILMGGDGDYVVTDVDYNAGTVSVTFQAGTDANLAAGATIHRLFNAVSEGATGELGGEVPDVTQTYNYTQNLNGRVSISQVERAVLRYGIADNEKRAIAHLLQSKFLEFEKACIYNLRVGPHSNSVKARFGGLRQYIRNGTMNQPDQLINAAGATLTEPLFERVTRAIYLAGGAADTIMVPPIQKSVIDDWNLPYARLEGFSEEKYGGIVSKYRNSFFDGEIIINRHLRDTDIIFLTKKFIGVGPLKGHDDLSFSLRLLADRGDTSDWWLSGTYTMEVRNNTRAHGWIYNLGT